MDSSQELRKKKKEKKNSFWFGVCDNCFFLMSKKEKEKKSDNCEAYFIKSCVWLELLKWGYYLLCYAPCLVYLTGYNRQKICWKQVVASIFKSICYIPFWLIAPVPPVVWLIWYNVCLPSQLASANGLFQNYA